MTRRKVILPYWTPSKEEASNKEALKNKFGDLSQGELIINNSTEGAYLTILDSNNNPSTFDSSKVSNTKISESFESATTFAVSAITETKVQLTDAISEAKEELTSALSEAKEELTSAITETKAEFTEAISKAKEELTSAITETKSDMPIVKGDSENSAVLKGSNNRALGKYATAFGGDNDLLPEEIDDSHPVMYSTAEGYASHSEGCAHAIGRFSHAEGGGNVVVEGHPIVPTAEGDYSHAEGTHTWAKGPHSHAEGGLTIAELRGAHAEGYKTHAKGGYSHAEGVATFAESGAHAEGGYRDLDNNIISGGTALGISSHAEGQNTLAKVKAAHAEGIGTTAGGQASHSEGNGTTAFGHYSHAEGDSTSTVSTANSAHAEGKLTVAKGIASHSEGQGTISNNRGEHAEGLWNKSNKSTIHSVGIGTSDTDRKNAHEITTDGKHYILGVGNYDGTTLDGATDVATVINNKADIPVVLLYVESANTILIKNHPAIPNSFNDFQSLQVWLVNQLLGRELDTLFIMVDEFHRQSCIKNYEITSVPSVSIIWECNNMKYQWLERGITKSPVVYADWYAVEGEPGYVENKPFYGNSYEEFFRKELDEFDSGALIGIIPYYDAMFQDEIRIQVNLEYGNMSYHDEHVLNINKALSGEDILYGSDRLVIYCYNEGNDIAIKIIDNENNYISGEVRAYRPNNLKTIEERYIPDTIARKDDLSSLQLGITSEKLHLLGVVDKEAVTSDTLYTSYTDVYIEDGELFALSDETYKVFGEKVEVDFEKLKTIPKVYYTWKDGSDDKPQIGTSAQKLREIYPEAVSEVDGKLAVSYHKLSIIALAAIDELHKENEELKARLKAIEDKLGL